MLIKCTNLLLTIVLLYGCGIFKKSPQKDYSQFIYENSGSDSVAIITDSTKTPDALVVQEKSNQPEVKIATREEIRLKNKYAPMLKVSTEKITDMKLYSFIDEWINTPYLWAGTTKNGIDCSAFIQRLFTDVYRIRIPRTSIQQFFTQNVERFTGRHSLAKGDLVFFKTMNNSAYVTHVGMYLDNNRFVNSSSSQGVSIASLNDPYWSRKFVGAGRLIVNKSVRLD